MREQRSGKEIDKERKTERRSDMITLSLTIQNALYYTILYHTTLHCSVPYYHCTYGTLQYTTFQYSTFQNRTVQCSIDNTVQDSEHYITIQ